MREECQEARKSFIGKMSREVIIRGVEECKGNIRDFLASIGFSPGETYWFEEKGIDLKKIKEEIKQ